jgi:hypothetical protein
MLKETDLKAKEKIKGKGQKNKDDKDNINIFQQEDTTIINICI